jgi:hypothetical protein
VPSTRLYAATAAAGDGDVLIRAQLRSILGATALLAVGFAIGLQASPAGISVFGATHSRSFDLAAYVRSKIADRPAVRVASLEADVAPESAIEEQESPSEPSGPADSYLSFEQRLLFDPRLLGPRFADAAFSPGRAPATAAQTQVRRSSLFLAPPDSREATRPAASGPAPKFAPVTAPQVWSSPSDVDDRTAIYDIAAHTVYLPNGQRLEAHSGLGRLLDDPRYVNAKGRGPTPPNVYDLTLREERFHGVRAIRLIPVGSRTMFGRDGMLAHSYMLGPNGQSNGCVSFSDYPAFLNAFLKGDVRRLVVVEHLATAPSSKAASGWLPEAIKALFKAS